jgi:ribosomal-protein-alanine N-acetyltransferase
MELGYWIAEPFWGQGYAAEAARTVVTFAFQQFEVERMQSHCTAENLASAHVLEKLGFQFEGIARSAVRMHGQFRDMRRYAILRGEWKI